MFYHLFPEVFVSEDLFGQPHSGSGHIAVDLDNRKAFGSDVCGINGIIVYQDGFPIVERFEEGIAETLEIRGIGDQVCMGVDVVQGIDLPAAGGGSPLVVDDVRYEEGVHAHDAGIFPNPLFIVISFVTGGVGDDQFGFGAKATDELDGVFDSFSFDHPRGLQNEQFIALQSQGFADISSVVIYRGWGIFKIHHIGNHGRRDSCAQAELVVTGRIDHHMLYGWDVGGECHVEIFPDGVDHKLLAFPEKIMVVGDGVDTGFGDEFGQRKPQGHIHGDGQAVLGDQHVDVMVGHELIELVFEQAFDSVDLGSQRAIALIDAETVLVDLLDDGVLKMGLFYQKGEFWISVKFPREIKTGQSLLFKYAGPLLGFQRNPVRTCYPGRYKTHIVVP